MGEDTGLEERETMGIHQGMDAGASIFSFFKKHYI